MTSTGTNLSSRFRAPFHDRTQVAPVLEPRVLPQTQAGFARWSSPALCPTPLGAWNKLTPERSVQGTAFDNDAYAVQLRMNDDKHHVARKKIGTGARAINRLLLSLWFLLLPMIWPSSDWIGLVILSQAFFVAANLIRPGMTRSSAAASPEGAVEP